MPEGTALAPYWSKGFQEMADSCTGARSKIPCRDMCTAAGQIARGVNLTCLTTGWSECDIRCSQSRAVASKVLGGKCISAVEKRTCGSGSCDMVSGDMLLMLSVHFHYRPAVERSVSQCCPYVCP